MYLSLVAKLVPHDPGCIGLAHGAAPRSVVTQDEQGQQYNASRGSY